jgi:hypothetical protein
MLRPIFFQGSFASNIEKIHTTQGSRTPVERLNLSNGVGHVSDFWPVLELRLVAVL